MSYTFDIDVGGTFTDCFITKGNTAKAVKTPTTYYDLSVCFMNAIQEGAKLFDETLESALIKTKSIRYSTTIGTNALIERNGPKIGLITTSGFEDTVFIGRSRQWADGQIAQENRDVGRIKKPEPLIDREMVVGLNERIDSFGKVVVPIKKEEILEKVQYLVDKGATGIVVGLLWSFLNPTHEELVKEVIEEEYPDAFLGHIPVLLSSEISPKSGEYGRMMTAIVNLYIHEQLTDQVGDISEKLRELGYKKPLILVHNTGGMKKATRTKSISTHNAGPVAGVYGSTFIGDLYQTKNIIFTDMGGTSFDIGIVADRNVPYVDKDFVIDHWRTQINAVQTKSIGAGGGSIAWLNESFGNLLEVGPRSARAMPGPAAYNLGGEEPTVTDADIVLGYINPKHYLGGEMELNYDLAFQAIEKKIAKPLGISVIEAAARIRKIVDAHMGHEIYKEVALKGHDPSDFIIFAGGGAGPVHCCGFNEYIEASKIITCPFSSVFGAFGASTLNVMHLYEQSSYMKLTGSKSLPEEEIIKKFNEVIQELKADAIRDFLLEGYSSDAINYTLSLEMKYGSQVNTTKITSPLVELEDIEDIEKLSNAFKEAYSDRYSSEAAYPEGGIVIDTFILKAEVDSTNYVFEKKEKLERPKSSAVKETRDIYSFIEEKMIPSNIYDFDQLEIGTVIQAPAVIESSNTNYVVEKNYQFILDEFGNGIFERLVEVQTVMKVLEEERV
jgi:N-methylhydantoinase A/acetophenone carboxylase